MEKTDINPATGKMYAVNPQTGNFDDNYWAQVAEPALKAQYGGGASTGATTSNLSGLTGQGTFGDIVKQALQMTQTANQPAIQSYQQSLPEVATKYATQKAGLEAKIKPLEDRYKALLDEIKGTTQPALAAAGARTAEEFGRRGIPLQSDLYAKELGAVQQPITTAAATNVTNVGLAREESLRTLQDLISGLGPQQTGEERAIQNAIAQLQSGAASSGVNTAMDLYKTQIAQQGAQQTAQAVASQQAIENALAQAKLTYESPAETALKQAQAGYYGRMPSSSSGGGVWE